MQSDLGTSYLAVKEYLEQGRKVLFSGTPCQIDGLKCFLKQEYENLYLLDVVCHGVPAPGVWDEYLGHLEKRKNGKAVQVSFRDKQISWRNYLLKIVFDNGKCYTSNRAQDLYMCGFLHNCYLRPSCYHCKHKGVDRTADLTLADFWGVDEICPEMDDDKGTSLVIVTTQKGKELFEQISGSVRSHEVNIKECVSFNPSMIEPARYSANRDSFEKEFRSMPIKRLLRKYCSLPIHKKVIDKIRRSFRLCSPCK